MPDGLATTVPYPTPPAPMTVQSFLKLIEETGEPERIPGLSRTKPDLLVQDHEIVCIIYVKSERRGERNLICCTICNDKPKFLNGALLWSSDGFLRLVGNCCAGRYFHGGRFAQMRASKRAKDIRTSQENWLLERLPTIPELIRAAEELKAPADFIDRQKGRLRREATVLLSLLQRTFKVGAGELTLERRIQGTSGLVGLRSSTGQASEYETDVVGVLSGSPFVSNSFRPAADVRSLLETLKRIRVDDALEVVSNMSEAEVGETSRAFLGAIRDGRQLTEKLVDAASFLSRKNVEILARWFNHPDNPLDARVETFPNKFRIRLADLSVVSLETNVPPMPDVGCWNIPPPT